MIILLVLPRASALEIPVRASLTEWVEVGERPVAADAALAASVYLSNPATGAVFSVSGDELVADQHTASGAGAVGFAGDPAGTIRTWALYYLDADGRPLGDPEIVDVLFDDNGNAGIAARDGGAPRVRSVDLTAERGICLFGGCGSLRVETQDAGTLASFVGIVELRTDGRGSDMESSPDLEVMDATVYAAYQGLGLDALVALDTFRMRVDGEIEVRGLTVDADGTVEGGAELYWDLAFELPGETTTFAAISYDAAVGKVKRKSQIAPRVNLKMDDVYIDSYDAATTVSLPGDLGDLELIARLDAYDGDTRVESAEGVVVDPSSLTVQGWGSWDTVFHANDVLDTDSRIVVLDPNGRTVSTHICTLAPTARTLAGEGRRDVYVGECTRDDIAEVRRLKVTVDADGVAEATIDLAGAVFNSTYTSAASDVCPRTGCPEPTVTSLIDGGSVVLMDSTDAVLVRSVMEVQETDFAVPFAFSADPSELAGELMVEISDPTRPGVVWSESDGTLTGRERATVVHTIEVEDVSIEGSADVALKGVEDAQVTIEEGAQSASLALRINRMTVRRAAAAAAPISAYASHLPGCSELTGRCPIKPIK